MDAAGTKTTPERRGGGRPAGRGVAVAVVAALLLPASALALPPDGVEETPGTPAGTVEVTTPTVPQKGKVGFCVRGFRVDLAAGGSVGQRFMVKLDDFGSYGIGPFTPDAAGDLCAEVSTNPADHAGAKGGAADKIAPDLCDPTVPHLLRFLSGPWAYSRGGDVASMRSLHATFRFSGKCGDPAPDTGGGNGGTTSGPSDPGGTGTGSTPKAPSPAVAPRLASTALRASGRRLTVRLRPVAKRTRIAIAVRTKAAVTVGGRRRIVTLVRRTGRTLPAGTRTRPLRLTLTADGRALLRARRTAAARVTVAPAGGTARTTTVRLRDAGRRAR